MRIHKAGYKVIVEASILFAALVCLAWLAIPAEGLVLSVVITVVSVLLELFVFFFFRIPKRVPVEDESGAVYAPADGEVVAIEPVYEDEYMKDEMIQISIFMSLWNVHANFLPVSGKVDYFRHHKGSFLVAWHPKSSTENERTSIVVSTEDGSKVMFRQIAGFIARRIVTYIKEGSDAKRGKQFGFIKFGSRVDVFLPLGSHVFVQIGDSTVGSQTKIAQLPSKCK